MFSDQTLTYFFFGHKAPLDIIGWHIAILITAIITWQLAKIWYHRKD